MTMTVHTTRSVFERYNIDSPRMFETQPLESSICFMGTASKKRQ